MDKEKPFEPLLHRELHIHDVTTHFSQQLDLIRDVVNYGTNLIPACFQSSARQLSDVVVLPVLLKQLVSMLDGFEILVSSACIPAAQLQSRSLFESSVYIDFIFRGDEEKKARCFYIANVRSQLAWALRSQEGTAEHANFFSVLGEFGDELKNTVQTIAETSAAQIEEIQQFLSKEPWVTVNSLFDKAKGKKKYDVAWYVPFGQGNVRSLCALLGRLHEYELFYSSSSEKVHSADYKSHIEIGKGKIAFHPIRNLEGIDSLLKFSLSVTFHTYREILQRYRPGQLTEFARRYAEHKEKANCSLFIMACHLNAGYICNHFH